ncbi:hypothetical protein EDD17DRAFT_475985 [Pisolithus thermaeus]|nr:hypothetical protein EDD17DRAFT_475985 [Pisolithus thermaeus]
MYLNRAERGAPSDNEEIHVYTPRDRGKRKADGSFYDNILSSETPSMDVDRASTNVSDTAAHKHIMPNASSSDDESLYESLYESAVDLDMKSKALVDDDDVDVPPHTLDHLDLASSVKGLYRVLDLISEQSSGGLVDKIVISQNTLEAFLNIVCPGAYASVTKVNFKALDQYIVKPVGVYGSKAVIIRLLSELRVVDDALAARLLVEPSTTGPTKSTLRSGLYLLRPAEPYGHTEQIFVIYWPQESTWDDSAPSQVRRNRVTFMRYLTKMCDQVVALISSAHAQTIVWNDGGRDDEARDDDDDGDAIINCVVDRTTEQEESVQVREGFKVESGHITYAGSTSAASVELGQPRPFLLFGETAQGFMTAQQQAAGRVSDNLKARSLTTLQLESHLVSDRLCLSESLDGGALNILVRNGLRKRFPDECAKWERDCVDVEAQYKRMRTDGFNQVKANLDKGEENLTSAIHEAVIDTTLDLYPFLERESFRSPKVHQTTAPTSFRELVEFYPRMGEIYRQNIKPVETISNAKFRDIKDRLCLFVGAVSLAGSISESQRHEIAKAAQKEGLIAARNAVKEILTKVSSTTHTTKLAGDHSTLLIYNPSDDKVPFMERAVERAVNYVTSWIRSDKTPFADRAFREALPKVNDISDSRFLKEIANAEVVQEDPELRRLAHEANMEVQPFLATAIPRVVKKLVKLVRHTQEDTLRQRIQVETESREEEEKRKLRLELIRHVNDSTSHTHQPHTLFIDSVEENKSHRHSHHSSSQWRLSGIRETQEDPVTCFTVHVMSLTEQDKHNLQLDASAVLTPHFHFEHKFRLTEGHTILRAQLLEGEKLLLVVSDRIGNLIVYLDHLTAIDAAIARGRGKSLNREKIGQDFVLAFDESRRMLGIVSSNKLLLHIFVHDDARGLQAQGSSIDLNAWYNEGTFICHSCFVGGSEELLLVDSQAQARIYSLVTMQFRPATLNLPHVPSNIHSTPDGSCLLVSYRHGDGYSVTAYHWSSFGSTEGIQLNVPGFPVDEPFVVTSLVSRTAVHLLWLDFPARRCQSYALDITRRATEFMFRERVSRGESKRAQIATAHNCLVDCHSEVWIRFPVLAAVQRETISSASLRSQKSLVFVTDRDFQMFAQHFSDMIYTFESTSKKPTGDVLRSVKVSAAAFSAFVQDLWGTAPWNVSQYRAGEWIVDFLCLIPIHIALTRENRFIPLKDGVYSTELERLLLGAEVNRIVDSISFGWYESLFQSYMATKPVRVVSSMGEQSVGKSYALNHLVDTSFAGSAMRTTEGVWMSVTPTEKELIVALDFEGVHSIERSAQEDTLLVLFNTAISNLVLFRNNFALSRDIAGLFQAFQSSATVLDPAANPSLFQSTLVIIIKDVVEADRSEIAREFTLKFQRIVQDEQETNFITRLHAGKLVIIAWPVIESQEFYKRFPKLKRHLDQQVITHHTAGEFLHTVKTLMAKLKANDWGAMSQTMASHRAQLLSSLLPNALAFGFQEVDPEREPLKNLDTDMPVELPDTDSRLFLTLGMAPQSENREQTLETLRSSWERYYDRQNVSDSEWVEALSQYLDDIVNFRIDRVQEWLSQNLARFQTGHASTEELRRNFEGVTVDLRTNVQLCKLQCADCQLLCIQSRFHDGPHACPTNHLCIHECHFCRETIGELRECGMPAGHAGKHICVVNAHLCGKPCKFEGRPGCLYECVKVVNHSDEHLCAVSVHACGKPCSLSGLQLADESYYSCPGFCRIPSDVDHIRHECETRLCSITCQLCKRLCSDQDHMHGLEEGAVHLCGQEHPCTAICSAQGTCEIETAPHSIEATFTGRHETFQYTKYSQVAKRLKCVKPVPPGATEHEGSHNHSLDKKIIHFCETRSVLSCSLRLLVLLHLVQLGRCESCGYFCTLPIGMISLSLHSATPNERCIGHPQQEHETRHGSMSRTRWTIDGPDDGAALEIEGRRFSTNDEGAPMMCNLVCQAMGRHVHIDYCRSDQEAACVGTDEIQHITRNLRPDPDRPKDYVTHNVFWKRSGFKDPYSKEEQAVFAKCDAMCSGPEHAGDAGNLAQPSYCTSPMFHPLAIANAVVPAVGYISNDGHHFTCRNPVIMQQAFHVIFVADRSGSMGRKDRRPLQNTPASSRICARSYNRFGAVLSSLFSFWSARAAAVGSSGSAGRRDAYSVILFHRDPLTVIENDLTSNPDQLLDTLLPHQLGTGTNFTAAIAAARTVMERNWSAERSPVIIFLSDGECRIADQTMQDLCRSSVRLGKAVSFHAVSFGPDGSSTYLRRMAEIAINAQNNAPGDRLAPAAATVMSSYSQALDSVQLAETFLGIAESLRKPRGALMH